MHPGGGMNSSERLEEQPSPLDKGKSRAQEPTERTPLLAETSRTTSYIGDEPVLPASSRSLWSKLTSVFLISLSICIFLFVLLALLAWSYAAQASKLSPDDIINDDLTFKGPTRVDVLNVTSGRGVWINVEGWIGLDAGAAIGVQSDPDDGFFHDMWKAVGRWSVRTLDRVTVDLTTMRIITDGDSQTLLATVEIAPLEVPLTVDPPEDLSWLTRISIPLLIRPTTNTSAILHFLRDSWRDGTFSVRADVGQAAIRGGALRRRTWRSQFHGRLSNIKTSLRLKIPPIPGLPHPGKHLPLPAVSELVTLQTFSVSSEANNLTLTAQATIIDPFPSSVKFTSPPLPYIISLPSDASHLSPPLHVASVITAPFTLTHPNITLHISGHVLPLPSTSFPILSNFLTRYLSGTPNPIIITSPFIPNITVTTDFPAPNPRPHLLRNVTIRDMKIRPVGTTFVASGIVYARVVLPKGVNVGVDVYRVLPDVLIFDGEVPDNTEPWIGDAPPSPPLPNPLPERAFGHIRPDDWLPSISVPSKPEEGEGTAYEVTAKVVDVPLEVLPGRQKAFGDFVSKVSLVLSYTPA
ncbi:hypothetical protein BDQ12DRAFT_694555 [Crucibulum laeve]|uniref:Uncharacterized protein n=1 Tax=Crucibulum laeve TaxID=68775 RepID=A0A5C3LEA0_9AGAR|nr:hypothetical protein BDQ12DRAFT_694555 [Crucibulum laeve]